MGTKKIAIVASEGGMSCAYSVGAILALVEKFDLVNPYLVIGSSGSTGTFAYYVAGQYKSIRNIWENLLPSKKFISWLRLNILVIKVILTFLKYYEHQAPLLLFIINW